MPVGDVNVTSRLKVPETKAPGAVLRKNVPRLLAPLRAPIPRKVVFVNELLPVKLNCGTPMIAPLVKPEIVTSLARAWPCASTRTPTRVRAIESDFSNVVPRDFIVSLPQPENRQIVEGLIRSGASALEQPYLIGRVVIESGNPNDIAEKSPRHPEKAPNSVLGSCCTLAGNTVERYPPGLPVR